MWWVVLNVYIYIYKHSNYYLYSKITRRPYLFANLSISSSCHVGWLCSFLRIPFQLIYKPVRELFLCYGIPKKKCLYVSIIKSFFSRKLFASRNQMDWPPCIAYVLNIKREQTSVLIGWTAVAMVTEEDISSIAYLKTAALSVDQLYYHKLLIRSISVALSVTSTQQQR